MPKIKNTTLKALLWLQGYTKTDMVYLASGGFWAVFSQLVVSFGTFLLAIAFAHFVSKEAYGEYKYILSIAGILGTFTLNGLATPLIKSLTNLF